MIIVIDDVIRTFYCIYIISSENKNSTKVGPLLLMMRLGFSSEINTPAACWSSSRQHRSITVNASSKENIRVDHVMNFYIL